MVQKKQRASHNTINHRQKNSNNKSRAESILKIQEKTDVFCAIIDQKTYCTLDNLQFIEGFLGRPEKKALQ